jgi:hypothetical protein
VLNYSKMYAIFYGSLSFQISPHFKRKDKKALKKVLLQPYIYNFPFYGSDSKPDPVLGIQRTLCKVGPGSRSRINHSRSTILRWREEYPHLLFFNSQVFEVVGKPHEMPVLSVHLEERPEIVSTGRRRQQSKMRDLEKRQPKIGSKLRILVSRR